MDDLDPFVPDQELLDEIDLLGELVIAATNNIGQLSTDRIDAILGVECARSVCAGAPGNPLGLPRQRDSLPGTVDLAGVRTQEHAPS